MFVSSSAITYKNIADFMREYKTSPRFASEKVGNHLFNRVVLLEQSSSEEHLKVPKISINSDNLNFTFEVVRCTGDPWSLASTINEYTPFPSASTGSQVASRSKSLRVVMTPCSWNIYANEGIIFIK